MTRFLLMVSVLVSINIYAFADEDGRKRSPLDYHIEHPEHIPHHHGKHSTGNDTLSGDDEALPRKRKYLHRKQVIVV